MTAIAYRIKLGSVTYSSTAQSRLLDLIVSSSLEIPVNQCRIMLALPLNDIPALQDAVTVELGTENQLTLVFKGIVSQMRYEYDRLILYGNSCFQSLLTAYFNCLYEKSTAGDIVKDLAQNRLKLKTSQVQDGVKFPSYALGNQQNAYDHLHNLALHCGFDLYADAEDHLVFAKYKASQPSEVRYGVDVLEWSLAQGQTPIAGVQIYGESPASQGQGEQASSWLTKKDVKGSAGQSRGAVLRLIDPAARNQRLSDQMAQARFNTYQRSHHGKATLLGNPAVKLGQTLKFSQMPDRTQNRSFQIVSVHHRLNRHQGFLTRVQLEEA